MKGKSRYPTLFPAGDMWGCAVYRYEPSDFACDEIAREYGDTAPLAICKAALEALAALETP